METIIKEIIDTTKENAPTITPSGKSTTPYLFAISKTKFNPSPSTILQIAPCFVAFFQISPRTTAGNTVDANAPHPNTPNNATSVSIEKENKVDTTKSAKTTTR